MQTASSNTTCQQKLSKRVSSGLSACLDWPTIRVASIGFEGSLVEFLMTVTRNAGRISVQPFQVPATLSLREPPTTMKVR